MLANKVFLPHPQPLSKGEGSFSMAGVLFLGARVLNNKVSISHYLDLVVRVSRAALRLLSLKRLSIRFVSPHLWRGVGGEVKRP
jgi:hypothetical protein